MSYLQRTYWMASFEEREQLWYINAVLGFIKWFYRMDISINITEDNLSQDDILVLKDCLGLEEADNIEPHLVRLCKTAFMEYCKMFKEKGLPTRADEVQQERLFYLLLHYFQNRIPYEYEISSIFQITVSQSRTLLRNTLSRFRTNQWLYSKYYNYCFEICLFKRIHFKVWNGSGIRCN